MVMISKSNKLEEVVNYNVWKFKMRVLLKRENMWDLVERKVVLILFLMLVGLFIFIVE